MALSSVLDRNFLRIWPWATLACVLIWTGIRFWLGYRRLRHIKGPWLASFSNLWLFYHTVRLRLYLAGEGVLRRYGA